MAFADDIQSRDTALFPVIEFEIPEGDILRVSIKPFTLEGNYYSPLLLSSPSINESIDLENRKYKISTVTLSLSNVEVGGIRFSDNKIPFNTGVSIYWVSPSCTTLSDCYLAFKGSVRQISHDEKTCSITVEDTSQSSLHKDVPVTLLGTGDSIPDRYKGKPIPMVYGTVNNSPCVISSTAISDETGEGVVTVTVDNADIDGSDAVNPLRINRDDLYWEVLPDTIYSLSGDEYQVSHQYELDGNSIKVQGILNTYSDMNLIADGMAQVVNRNKIEGLTKFRTFGSSDYAGVVSDIEKMIDDDIDTYGTVTGDLAYEVEPLPSPGEADIQDRDVVALYAQYPQIDTKDIVSESIVTRYYPRLNISVGTIPDPGGAADPRLRFFTGGEIMTLLSNESANFEDEVDLPITLFNEEVPDRFSLVWDVDQAYAYASFEAKVYDLKVDTFLDIDKIFDSDFYAHINGRTN